MNSEAHFAGSTPPHRAAEIDGVSRVLHLALVMLGVAAWLSGDLAGEHERRTSLGFVIHSWLGMAAAVAVGLRIVWGVVGPRAARFSSWLPVTRDRLRLVLEDVQMLLRFRIPERSPREGLAGVVQMIGLLIFTWLAVTGSLLFFGLEPGTRPGGWLDLVGDLHGIGELLIPAFLAVHVGATIAHALAGDERWRIMFFIPPAEDARRPPQ